MEDGLNPSYTLKLILTILDNADDSRSFHLDLENIQNIVSLTILRISELQPLKSTLTPLKIKDELLRVRCL